MDDPPNEQMNKRTTELSKNNPPKNEQTNEPPTNEKTNKHKNNQNLRTLDSEKIEILNIDYSYQSNLTHLFEILKVGQIKRFTSFIFNINN
jgi:hypothetical protein